MLQMLTIVFPVFGVIFTGGLAARFGYLSADVGGRLSESHSRRQGAR